MGVSYAGTNLLLHDADGKIQEWFDAFLPLSNLRVITEWHRPRGNVGVSPYYPGQELPSPNYSSPPKPTINSWYRPTGASRWGFGFYLTDYKSLQTILAATSGNTPNILILSSSDNNVRQFQNIYLLPPHPISALANDKNGLWLLPLVDERWFWQLSYGGTASPYSLPLDGSSPTATSWNTLLGNLSGAYIQQFDNIPSPYLYPNIFFLKASQYASIGQYIDALAWSVGQRVIPSYPTGWRMANWGTSKGIRTSNLNLGTADQGNLQSGTLNPYPAQEAIAPYQVSVVFRVSRDGIIIGDWKGHGQRYIKNIPAANAGYTGVASTGIQNTVVILSTALADISTGHTNISPDNQATLDALALQIATDYYNSLWVQDSVVVGVSQWQESGYDNYVEFYVGNNDSRAPCTRIHSMPYNCLQRIMLHYDSTTWEYGERIFGTLDGNLAANGTQTITVLGSDGAVPTGTIHVNVTELLGFTGSSGNPIIAERMGEVWGVVDPNATAGASLKIGTFATTVVNGDAGTFTLAVGGTVTAGVRQGIAIKTQNYVVSLADDGNYYVDNPTLIFYGKLSAGAGNVAGTTGSLAGNGDQNAVFDIWTGTPGSEVADGAQFACRIRNGWCIAGKVYQLCAGASLIGQSTHIGFEGECINPDKIVQGSLNSGAVGAGSSGTFTIFTGTAGSESSSGITVGAFIRNGMCWDGVTIGNTILYMLECNGAGVVEVANPTLAGDGSTSGTILTGTTGAAGIAGESPVGTATTSFSVTVYNRYTAPLTGKFRIEWNMDSRGWVATVKYP